MMQERPVAKKLSKAVLELKFMKKSKEKALVQEENEERQQLYQDQLSSLHEGAEKIVMVNSYVDCLKFLPCRLSFGGMDPDIEKLNEDKLTGLYTVERTQVKEDVTQMNTDLSVEEMGVHFHIPGKKPPFIKHKREEENDGVEEEGTDGPQEQHNNHISSSEGMSKKPKLRPLYKMNIDGERDQEQVGGGRARFSQNSANFRGKNRQFRGDRGGHSRGDRGGHSRGDRGGHSRGDRGRHSRGDRGGHFGGDRGGHFRGHKSGHFIEGNGRNFKGSKGDKFKGGRSGDGRMGMRGNFRGDGAKRESEGGDLDMESQSSPRTEQFGAYNKKKWNKTNNKDRKRNFENSYQQQQNRNHHHQQDDYGQKKMKTEHNME